MTTTAPPTSPRRSKDVAPSVPPVSAWPRLIAAAVAVLAACLLLWGGLFAAFGTTNGSNHSARRFSAGFDTQHASGLGHPERGPEWSYVGGWAAVGGQASVTELASSGSTVAIADLGSRRLSISAVARRATAGWGLTVRYRDNGNYWYVTAGPTGVLQLGIVRSGLASIVKPLDATLVDGSRVTVQVDSASIEIRLDDQLVAAVRDDRLNSATSAGLLLQGTDVSARWDDVTGGPLPDQTIVIPKSAP